MSSVPERGDIDERYKWDLGSLFTDDEEWEQAYEAVEERLADVGAFEGRATESAATVRELFDTYDASDNPQVEMRCLSIGMSNDFEIAVEEGATMLRLGSALFGPRDYD